MSLWGDIRDRANGEQVKKEDIIPITLKVTKREPYYDWTIHQLRFNTDKGSWIVRIPFDSFYYDEDIQYFLKEQGVDIKGMSQEMWEDFKKEANNYKSYKAWRLKQWEKAKEGGSSYLRYTYRKKSLGGIYWLVNITLHMFGQWRKFQFVSTCRYENTPSEETMHNYVFDTLRHYLKGYMKKQDARFYLTKEEWEDNQTFKELFDAGVQTCKWYNDEEYSHFSPF